MENETIPFIGFNTNTADYGSTLWGSFVKFLINTWPHIVSGIQNFFDLLITLSFPVSVFLFIMIIFVVEGLKKIRNKEEEMHTNKKVEPGFEAVPAHVDPALSHRWENVKKHIEGPTENDWKQAIIEADIMLDLLLTNIGYRGESVGEKLKRVEPAQFDTLQEAWDAHKVRNTIAHDGSSFSINQHEAKRVIQLYRKVFEEFYYF